MVTITRPVCRSALSTVYTQLVMICIPALNKSCPVEVVFIFCDSGPQTLLKCANYLF